MSTQIQNKKINDESVPISKLESIPRLNSDDLFIVERSYQNETGHQNAKIEYSQISARMLQDISSLLNLNTMAYKESYEYSKIVHNHDSDYCKTECGASYSVFHETDDYKTVFLGKFVTYELNSNYQKTISETSVYFPMPKFKPYIMPDIGEMRLMGWPRYDCLNSSQCRPYMYNNTTLYTIGSIDGFWALPGQTINCSQNEFMDACEVFANSRTATSFSIPLVKRFAKMNPGTNANQPIEFTPGKNCTPMHSHQIPTSAMTFSNAISFSGSYIFSTYRGGSNGAISADYRTHFGTNDTKTNEFLSVAFSNNFNNMTTNQVETNYTGYGETKPRSNNLIALVYLGNR